MWEYLYFKAIPRADFDEEWLNERGKEDWELVYLAWNHIGAAVVFKRPKEFDIES